MMQLSSALAAVAGLLVLAVAVAGPFSGRSISAPRVSRLGEYQGYASAHWDGYVRRSDYLALSDGTQLAFDLLLPTRKGVQAAEPLPVPVRVTVFRFHLWHGRRHPKRKYGDNR